MEIQPPESHPRQGPLSLVAAFAALERRSHAAPTDWLIDPVVTPSGITINADRGELVLSNELIRRTFQTTPIFDPVGFENGATWAQFVHAVRSGCHRHPRCHPVGNRRPEKTTEPQLPVASLDAPTALLTVCHGCCDQPSLR